METQVQLTVGSVVSRMATRKSDGQKFTLYDVALSDGETYTTMKREIAEQAHALTGQIAVCTIKVEANGIYTNRYLNAIGGTMGGIQGPAVASPAPMQVAIPGNTIPAAPSKDDQIHRQTAAKVAAVLSTDQVEFWGNVDALVAYFETGTKPLIGAGTSFVPAAAADDDIPF